MLDPRAAGTRADRPLDACHRFGLALDECLDLAIGKISHVACHTFTGGRVLHEVAEADPLHASADKVPAGDAHANARLYLTPSMPLDTGARLGRYVIEAPVGAGGMGDVYRARDSRLNRVVAVKVLSPHLSSHPEGRHRFEREARTLATLSHPHICPIYDVGREEDRDYLVMEFLDGETLARRLARGPLPIDEALGYAIAIAEGLAAAHAHGIVHRDLKPGNVMLTAAGVKLVDFGIARTEPTASGATATVLTVEGSVVGTYEYMAPEQLQGLAADARADLFAFGVVLHEMLTGHLPSTPGVAVPAIPALLERFIGHCLVKQPEERWSSAHDAVLLLRDIADGQTHTPHDSKSPLPRSRGAWAAAALATAVAIGLAGALYLRPVPPAPVRRLSVLPPPGTTFALEEAPQISPDGSRLMFVAMDDGGINRLYIRPLDSLDASLVPGTEGGILPFWAPDSRGVAFFADGWLKVIEAGGSGSRNLARAATPRGGTWRDDGEILFVPFPALPVHRISIRGGSPVPLSPPRPEPMYRWFPQWMPQPGDRYLFHHYSVAALDTGGRIGVADLDGAVSLVFDSASAPIYAPPGHLLFRRGASLAALPFDPNTLKTSGTPAALRANLGQNPITNQPPFSVSNTGVLTYFETTPTSQLTRVNRTGAAMTDVGAPGTYNSVCGSADTTELVADGTDPAATNLDIWKPEPNGQVRRLTFHEAIDFYPVCSPDGKQVVFASLRNGPPDLYRMFTNAPGTEQVLLDTPTAKLPIDWSADGRWVFFSTANQGDWDIWAVPLHGEPKPVQVIAAPGEQREGRLSPDGRWFAYVSNESGRFEVYVTPFPTAGPRRWQISSGGGTQPQWRGDGRELFYLSGTHTITAVDVRPSEDGFEVGTSKSLFGPRLAALERMTTISQYVVSAKGDAFVINRPSDAAAAQTATVVLNWPALLRP